MNKKVIIGAAIAIIGFIFCFFFMSQVIHYRFMNPDVTRLRCLLDNPRPTVNGLVSLAVAAVGVKVMVKGADE